MKTRVVTAAVVFILLALPAWSIYRQMSPTPSSKVTVFLEDYCRCCQRWAQHMIDNGYAVEMRPVTLSELRSLRRRLGIPEHKEACHTALVDGYIVEGHVPADIIDKVLQRRTALLALAVPGMPHGSPGMEDTVSDRYHVYAKRNDGRWEVIATRGVNEAK